MWQAMNPHPVNLLRIRSFDDSMKAFIAALSILLAASSLRAEEADLCIYEATPGGIAMAVRAAREGLRVVLVNHNAHLGGILSSGLGVWDTLWEGKRAPIYDEARQAIFEHYRTTYGEKSPQYQNALPGKSGHTNGKFEPHVAEMVLTRLVTQEKNITVVCGYYPKSVQRDGPLLKSVTFGELDGKGEKQISAKVFADCSYEGDLAAMAKVPYRVTNSRSPMPEWSTWKPSKPLPQKRSHMRPSCMPV